MEAGECSASSPSVSAARFKREDHKRTKHDSHFSKWQVLIGPCDWEDYGQGKEGAARYRVHNLPTSSAPGLYELGVAVSGSGLGREYVGKLDPDDIVVVYLGQADNVRTRLQTYGRSGAHLGNSCASGHWSECKTESPQKGFGLFEEIFSKGHSIVYRWAPMRDKRTAEKTEAQLLDTFDYAWNKGSNGARRPNDIIHRLGRIASSSNKFSRISKKFLFLRPGQVGIKIEAGKPPLLEEECSVPANDQDGKSSLNGIFKFSRWQPRLVVSEKSGTDENSSQICGIITSEGIPCEQPPVPGRKRCKQHKGMRIYGLRTKPIIGEANSDFVYLRSSSTVCGVNFGYGDFCKKEAVPGRKRCEEHKGMRIERSVFKPISDEEHSIPDMSNSNASASNVIGSVNEQFGLVCGANLGNGSVCRRQPIRGNKRCWQHKGRKATGFAKADVIDSSSMFETLKCGVRLQDGFICTRTPVRGRKRCEEHKGMRC